jgi:exopolysaccharide production protein ExoQ
MNRRLSLNSSRPRPQASPSAATPASVPDTRGSMIGAFMVWVLIIYLAVPVQYFIGDMGSTDAGGMGAGGMAAGGTDAGGTGAGGMAAPNPLARTIKLGLLVLSIGIVLSRVRLAWLECKALNRFFWVFLALVPLSIIWSINPSATGNRYVSLLSITAVCLAFTLLGWRRTRFQDVVRPVVTALLIASVIWTSFYPQYGIEVGTGTLQNSWRGLTSQKNQFGMLASFGVVFWLHAWFSNEKKWWIAFPFVGLSFMCILLSRSSTALLATTLSTFFMLVVMVAPASFRRIMPYIVSLFAILVVVYALAVLNIIPGSHLLLDPIAELSGKDMTFSNRAVIWDIIKEHIQLAPMLGSGYGAYWTGAVPSSPSYTFMGRMYFYPSESHNGYLEIVNDLGFVGLICLLGYLVYWISQSLQLMKIDRSQGMLFLALFFQQAVTNLSESTWLAINSAFAIAVATLATFSMARSLLEQRLIHRPSPPVKRRLR